MECVIYNIITNDGLYIGSTNNFKRRCWEHKSRVKSGDSQLLYKNITKNNGQYKIEIILELVCEDKTELRKIEEEYRILSGANLNGLKCFTTEDEKRQCNIDYKQTNRNEILYKATEYYKSNKQRIQHRNSIKSVCECGGCYNLPNRARHFKSKKHQAYLASL